MKFSANLGFLWSDLALPDAIHAAHAAGFHAVECHWPYAVPTRDVRAALAATGLPMLGLNTSRGAPEAGENGLCALPGREVEARASIDAALDYAVATGTGAVHVMAGFSGGPRAADVFAANLDHACTQAASQGVTILIEPLNHYDAPGYFLSTSSDAVSIIHALGHDNLRLMFDCYHLQIMGGDVTRQLARHMGLIGHIQIAGVPDRGTPDHGELDYTFVLSEIERLGWRQPIGAEYKTNGPTETTLGWMNKFSG